MSKRLQITPKREKLSALERVLLKKMKRSVKSAWMLEPLNYR